MEILEITVLVILLGCVVALILFAPKKKGNSGEGFIARLFHGIDENPHCDDVIEDPVYADVPGNIFNFDDD